MIESREQCRGDFSTVFLSDWMIVDIDNVADGDKFWLNNNSKKTHDYDKFKNT